MRRRRHLYGVELPGFVPRSFDCGFNSRQPDLGDLDGLADLMLDAYQGTIDYDGEDRDDARTEVASYLNGKPLLDFSVAVYGNDQLLAACLVSLLDDGDSPLIAYIMTRSHWKRGGLARHTLNESLTRLKTNEYKRVLVTITNGNTASERLFESVGFVRLE